MTFKEELIDRFQKPSRWYSTFAKAAMFGELDRHDNIEGVERLLVDSYGGEDQGSEYWNVYKFTKGDEELYVKFYGFYQSYEGAEYEGYRFVQPKQKVVTVYE